MLQYQYINIALNDFSIFGNHLNSCLASYSNGDGHRLAFAVLVWLTLANLLTIYRRTFHLPFVALRIEE
jgi:ABC-type polysaccharide/polyol phosphate transport system ATPase subunit